MSIYLLLDQLNEIPEAYRASIDQDSPADKATQGLEAMVSGLTTVGYNAEVANLANALAEELISLAWFGYQRGRGQEIIDQLKLMFIQ